MNNHAIRVFLACLTGALLLCAAGCDTTRVKKRDVGMVAGGAAGGALGSQFGEGAGKTWATIGGVLIGAAIGSYIGDRMDEEDRQEVSRTLEYSRTNETREWRNPDSGYEYQTTPTRTFKDSYNRDCREFSTKVVIDGRTENAYGTACRERDGTWKIVEMD